MKIGACLSRVGHRATSSASMLQTVQRRYAGAQYAHLKVKKSNWVEQNEILRENKFVNWTIDKTNIVAVATLALVVPLVWHSLIKDEMALREEQTGKKVVERL